MAVPDPVLAVAADRPELLRANTHQTDAHFLHFACQALGTDWHLLSKSAGENGYTWPNGVRTSHDAIVRVDGGQKAQVVDIIAAAGSGSPTSPAWGDVPPNQWRASNVPVPLRDVPAPSGGTSEVPPPPPPPPPSACRFQATDLAVVLQRIDGLTSALVQVLHQQARDGQRLATLLTYAEEAVDEATKLQLQIEDVRNVVRQGIPVSGTVTMGARFLGTLSGTFVGVAKE